MKSSIGGDDVHIHVDGSFLAQDELVDVVKRGLASGEGRVPKPMAIAIRDEQHYFATVSEVRALAERIQSVGDAKALADKARAAQVWAERARFGQEQVNLAAIARLWAERRAGELLAEIRGDAGRLPNKTVPDENISRKESHRFQRLAAIPADEFKDSIEAAAEEGAVSASREGQEAMSKTGRPRKAA